MMITIDHGHVNVPSHTWIVIMVLDDGDNDLNRVTPQRASLPSICRMIIQSVAQTTGNPTVPASIASKHEQDWIYSLMSPRQFKLPLRV